MVSIGAQVALIDVELAQPQLLISPTYPGDLIGRLASLSRSRYAGLTIVRSAGIAGQSSLFVLSQRSRCLEPVEDSATYESITHLVEMQNV
jgi:hypothetical protein